MHRLQSILSNQDPATAAASQKLVFDAMETLHRLSGAPSVAAQPLALESTSRLWLTATMPSSQMSNIEDDLRPIASVKLLKPSVKNTLDPSLIARAEQI